nr:MAG TPA: hypothetical protein [Caudoviricetes sp.]
MLPSCCIIEVTRHVHTPYAARYLWRHKVHQNFV